jgi:hypothetical protein
MFTSLSSNSRMESLDGTPVASDPLPTVFPGRISYITRTIKFTEFGTLYTKDLISFRNTDSEPLSAFYICLNQTLSEQLYDMTVKGVSGEIYPFNELSYKLSGYNTWKITFPAPLMPGTQTNFTVTSYFNGAVTHNTNSSGLHGTLYHLVYTLTPYYTDKTSVLVEFPLSTDILVFEPTLYGTRENNKIKFSATDSTPFFSSLLYVKFTHANMNYIETEKSIVTITTGEMDWDVSADLVISNLGPTSLSSLTFMVPKDAYGFTAKDNLASIGGLSDPDTESITGDYKNITINLLVNRYAITTGFKMEFTLSFRLPIVASRIVQGDLRSAIFIDVYRIVRNQWITRNVEIRIALPQATAIDFNLLNVQPEAVDNQDGIQVLIYKTDAVAQSTSKKIMFMYAYSGMSMQSRPLLIALVTGLAVMFSIIARKLSLQYQQPESMMSSEVPLETLKEFAGIFEDKVGTYLELDGLNEGFQRRKIKKREYQIKIEGLTRQIKLLDNQIKVSKRNLMAFGGRFKEIIEDLDLLEAERQSVQDSLITLENRYKDGQIKSRVAYEQLYENYTIRLKKIQSGIDSGINELKSYFS